MPIKHAVVARSLSLFMLAPILALIPGCPFLSTALTPNTTTVRLINNGDLPVEVVMYVGSDQNVLEDILTNTGERVQYTVPAGGTETFTRDCDELQAIIVDNAELIVIGGGGPDADTNVLRDGSDFNCGDTIEFTFDHSALLVDFDIPTRIVQ